MRADDDLIEALAAGLVPPPADRPRSDDVDDQLVALLAGWVADVRPETLLHRPGDLPPRGVSVPGPVVAPAAVEPEGSTDAVRAEPVVTAIDGTEVAATAEVATAVVPASGDDAASPDAAPIPITRGRHRRSPAPGRSTRVAAAAVFVVLAVSGVVAGAWDAKPGTVLWPVTRVVFAEKARSVQAATDVSTSLERARIALRDGRPAEAQAALAVVLAQLPDVDDAEGHDLLAAQTTEVNQQLATSDTGAAKPLSTDRSRTVLASGSAGAVITTAPTPPDGVGRPRGTNPAASEAAAALPGPVTTGTGTGTTGTGTTGTGTTGTGTGTTPDGGTPPGGTPPGDSTSGGSTGSGGTDVTTVVPTPDPSPPPPVVVVPPPPSPTDTPELVPTPTGTTPEPDASGSTSGGTTSTGGGDPTGAPSGGTPTATAEGNGAGSGGTGSGDGAGSSGSGSNPAGGGTTSSSEGTGASGGGSTSSGSGGSGDGSSDSSRSGGGSSSGGESGSSGTEATGASRGSTLGTVVEPAVEATTGTIDTIAGVLTTGTA